MTASQKSRLGQGLFFGLFFVVLGCLMKFWNLRDDAPYYGGQISLILGIVIVLWGAFPLFSKARE